MLKNQEKKKKSLQDDQHICSHYSKKKPKHIRKHIKIGRKYKNSKIISLAPTSPRNLKEEKSSENNKKNTTETGTEKSSLFASYLNNNGKNPFSGKKDHSEENEETESPRFGEKPRDQNGN